MKTYKIKLVVEDYHDGDVSELVQIIKKALPYGVLLVKVSAKEIE